TTCAPSRAKPMAHALPSPLLDAATKATLPCNPRSIVALLTHSRQIERMIAELLHQHEHLTSRGHENGGVPLYAPAVEHCAVAGSTVWACRASLRRPVAGSSPHSRRTKG